MERGLLGSIKSVLMGLYAARTTFKTHSILPQISLKLMCLSPGVLGLSSQAFLTKNNKVKPPVVNHSNDIGRTPQRILLLFDYYVVIWFSVFLIRDIQWRTAL